MDKGKITTNILFVMLLVTAAVLRLYHPFSIPYTYDELSALFRTRFNNFDDLIAHGAMIDGHPVGIQVFLYYWAHLVAYKELYVKLPFILCGIASVFYVFKTGRDWFNPTVGLVCAAYMATLEYTIMHSQEARPYASGLFFSIAMAYHWSRVIFKPEKKHDLNWALYILFSALCAYDHYFCLLLAVITGFTGLLFVKKRYLLRYITAGIMIFVLYIPHLHIFFYQLLVLKGVGEWLNKPSAGFILKYLEYVFHFSPFVYASAAALLIFGLVHSIVRKKAPLKFLIISFSWFVVIFFTGYIYSVYVNPVLQYRVLIFCFPFLLFFIFGFLPDIGAVYKTAIIATICTVNILTLVYTRKYYQLYYQPVLEKVGAITDSVTSTIGKNGMLRFIEGDSNTSKMELFYIRRYRFDSTFVSLNNGPDKTQLADYLENNQRKFLSYGCNSEADITYLPLFLSYYPRVVKQYNFFGGNFYILSSVKDKGTSPYIFHSEQNFDSPAANGWSTINGRLLSDSVKFSGKYSYKMDSAQEYGPTFTYSLENMVHIKNDIIAVSAEIYAADSNMNDVIVVASLEAQGKIIEWRGLPVTNFMKKGQEHKWIRVYNALKPSDVNTDYPDVKVKIFIWNKGRRKFYIDNMDVNTIKGNPYLYGMEEKLQPAT